MEVEFASAAPHPAWRSPEPNGSPVASGKRSSFTRSIIWLAEFNLVDLLLSSAEAWRQTATTGAGEEACGHTQKLRYTTFVLTSPWRTPRVTAVGPFILCCKTLTNSLFPMNRSPESWQPKKAADSPHIHTDPTSAGSSSGCEIFVLEKKCGWKGMESYPPSKGDCSV